MQPTCWLTVLAIRILLTRLMDAGTLLDQKGGWRYVYLGHLICFSWQNTYTYTINRCWKQIGINAQLTLKLYQTKRRLEIGYMHLIVNTKLKLETSQFGVITFQGNTLLDKYSVNSNMNHHFIWSI